jgi:hypothetical protein
MAANIAFLERQAAAAQHAEAERARLEITERLRVVGTDASLTVPALVVLMTDLANAHNNLSRSDDASMRQELQKFIRSSSEVHQKFESLAALITAQAAAWESPYRSTAEGPPVPPAPSAATPRDPLMADIMRRATSKLECFVFKPEVDNPRVFLKDFKFWAYIMSGGVAEELETMSDGISFAAIATAGKGSRTDWH